MTASNQTGALVAAFEFQQTYASSDVGQRRRQPLHVHRGGGAYGPFSRRLEFCLVSSIS